MFTLLDNINTRNIRIDFKIFRIIEISARLLERIVEY
jgi:hypothetical protein